MKNKLFELIAKRKSTRRYTDKHISDEIINEIMKVALLCRLPSNIDSLNLWW